ncbi:MAG: hypothetical protein WCT31_03265 [Candidatus Micrarchaeia archaeon]|jgi:hypothetical protein
MASASDVIGYGLMAGGAGATMIGFASNAAAVLPLSNMVPSNFAFFGGIAMFALGTATVMSSGSSRI